MTALRLKQCLNSASAVWASAISDTFIILTAIGKHLVQVNSVSVALAVGFVITAPVF
jgi:hypothetical protein